MPMWSFDAAAGWHEIDDFLQTPDAIDVAEERRLAGFTSTPSLVVGDSEGSSFCVEVYNRAFSTTEMPKGEGYDFLTAVEVGGVVYYVAIPNLPDLLEFLRQTIPLSVAIDEWSIKKERYIAELDKQLGIVRGRK